MELVEALIEGVVVQRLKEAVGDFDGVSVVGTWRPSDGPEVKGLDDKAEAVVGVKAFPRQYETPTVPSAEIQLAVSMSVRSDVDFGGEDYLGLTEKISEALQEWQNDFSSLSAFDVEGKFKTTGFNLTGGDCGLDRETRCWQYVQGFTVYGIVAKKTAQSDNNN